MQSGENAMTINDKLPVDTQYMTYLTQHKLTSEQYPMTQYVIDHHLQPKTDFQILKELLGLSPEDEMHQLNDRYMRGKR